MIKKIAFIIIALLSITTASAEGGSWKIHPVFGATPTNAIDVGDRIFYLVSNNLFCFDKDTKENAVYDKSNYLNDTQVKNIYYNYDKKYLVVAYNNSNIDIILENGRVKNIPDITNSLIPSYKTINHVTFCGNRIYVATAFGYVAIDDEKFEVAESRIYNKNLTSVAVCGDYILLGSASGTYIGLASKAHSTLDSYVLSSAITNGKFLPLTGNKFLTYGTNAVIYNVSANTDGTPTGLTFVKSLNGSAPQAVQPVKSLNKYMVLYTATPSYYTIDPTTAETSAAITLPTAVKSELLTSQETSAGEWWAVGSNGIHKVKISGTTAESLVDYQKINATTVNNAVHLVYNSNLDYLMVSNSGKCAITGDKNDGKTKLNILKGSIWEEKNPVVSCISNSSLNYLQNSHKPLIDPNEPNTFYIGTLADGLYKITDFEQSAYWHYDLNATSTDTGNSALTKAIAGYCNVDGYQFDKAGNLWVVQAECSTPLKILKKDRLNGGEPSIDDWIIPDINQKESLSGVTQWRQSLFITKKSDIKIYCNGGWTSHTYFIKDDGDPSSVQYRHFDRSNLYDQDNNLYLWTYTSCWAEDLNGKVWMGSSDGGVVEFDPEKVFDDSFRLNRIKVPRNDGTNNADYLLSGVQVNSIAVDDLNRKWIGTNAAGLYLVSADGSEIIEQFNTSNSILPTNQILSVCCKPNSNTVFVGTSSGVLEYESSSVTPAPSYDDVLVYPNPVRPEYTGAITIKGLMDNSLVKISDASGNVITSLQSTGGIATWDGLNASGERVKSGVYFVLASENEDESSSAIVAKFLVIK